MDGGVADTTCYYTGRLDGGGRGERHKTLSHQLPPLAPKCVRYVDITDRCSRRGDRGVVAFNTLRARATIGAWADARGGAVRARARLLGKSIGVG